MEMKKEKTIENVLKITFIFYFIFLLKMIVFKYHGPLELFDSNRQAYRSLNLEPFKGALSSKFLLQDTLGNIIAFLPLGAYYKLFNRERSFIKGILLCLFLSLVFETSQYVFGIGASDITDVISNTTGGILGMLGISILDKISKDRYKNDRFIAISASIIMIILMLLISLIYLVN